MRGIVLCGGLGTRLNPLTLVTNKHLLPVYDKPMCYYPIQTLVKAGITEILLVVSGPHAGSFITLLKNGEEFNLDKLIYAYQWKPNGGIADALSLAEDFANNEPIAVILGDNCTDANILKDVKDFNLRLKFASSPSAHLFLKKVDNPKRFGVPKIKKGKITQIIEKPENPSSNYAITGLYLYDSYVFDFIRNCKPSERGEMEISDVNQFYVEKGNVSWTELNGFWQDAGTFSSLYLANKYWAHQK